MLQDKKEIAFKLILFSLILTGIVILVFLGFRLFKSKDRLFGYSKISVSTLYSQSEVFLDGTSIGKTPIEYSSIKPGTHTLKVQGDSNFFETQINFSKNSQVVVTRDLGVSKLYSSGQIFALDDKDLSSKLNIVSEPSQATVYIDDSEVGKTPYSSTVLTDGEYDLRVEKPGFEPQIARIKVQKNFKLNVSVQLYPKVIPDRLSTINGTSNVYDLSTDIEDVFLDTTSWARGAAYTIKSRQNSTKFSYFVDYLGNAYDLDGKSLTDVSNASLKAGDSIGYLGKKSDNGITTEANLTLGKFGAGTSVLRIRVNNTGTGWLRVRSLPNINGEEIGKLNVGEETGVLEEKDGWVKVALKDGKQGWVSSSYVTKLK